MYMDLYGKPVQDIYSTFLHLSGAINAEGSLIYDGRGNRSIISLSDNNCRIGNAVTINDNVVNINGFLSINNKRFFISEDGLDTSAPVVLSLNRELSTIEMRNVYQLLPRRQQTVVLPSFTLPGSSYNIEDIRTPISSLSTIFEEEDLPKQNDEIITIQKLYYNGALTEIIYDVYKYSGEEWFLNETN